MALILSEEFTFRNNQDAFEKAVLFFSRIERLASVAMIVNEQRYGEFSNPVYREDCMFYQLEAIRDLSKQFCDLFDEVAIGLGQKTDERLAELEGLLSGSAELLPNDSGEGVLAGNVKPAKRSAPIANAVE